MMKAQIAAAALLVLLPMHAGAHHSGAMFDRTKVLTIKGVVKQYDYTSPHSWITMVITQADGKQVLWGIEGFTPASMSGWGLTPQTVKVGDEITVTTHPLRDGRNGGSLIEATLANGFHVNTSSDERKRPANAAAGD